MLDKLRSSAGSWVAKIFIALLAASFGVWGINDVFRGRTGEVLAQVGERQIGVEEFRQAFDQQVRAFSRRSGQSITAEQARQIGLDQQVLASLLQGATLESQAQSMRLAVPDKTIADGVAANPVFHGTGGKFDPAYFRRLLANAGMTEPQFLAAERQNKLRTTLSNVIDDGLKAPAPLVEAVWKYRNEQRDARYFVVMADISQIAAPGDQDLKTFYDANKGLFSIPERRAFSVIVADADVVGARFPVDEEQIKAEYERNKDSYGTPEKRSIQQIAFPNADEARKALERIKGGADFLAVAKERGLTEADATLGEFTRAQVPDAALADAAFKLEENTVSEPVAGKLATVLLRVTKIVPGTIKTLEETRPEIVKRIQHERGREEVLNLYDKVEDARAGGQSLEEIARAENLKLLTVPGVDRSGRDASGKEIEDFPVK
ncbi:MAG: SurA N-terminal domain-containing protein, partial [Parvibaculaceae bacterium]